MTAASENVVPEAELLSISVVGNNGVIVGKLGNGEVRRVVARDDSDDCASSGRFKFIPRMLLTTGDLEVRGSSDASTGIPR